MTTDTLTLTAFLEARIAEDEAVARAADTGARWEADALAVIGNRHNGYDVANQIETEQAEHVVRWDPARVLAECAAKRALVARGELAMEHDDLGSSTWDHGMAILEALASVYSDHPDFNPDWS